MTSGNQSTPLLITLFSMLFYSNPSIILSDSWNISNAICVSVRQMRSRYLPWMSRTVITFSFLPNFFLLSWWIFHKQSKNHWIFQMIWGMHICNLVQVFKILMIIRSYSWTFSSLLVPHHNLSCNFQWPCICQCKPVWFHLWAIWPGEVTWSWWITSAWKAGLWEKQKN